MELLYLKTCSPVKNNIEAGLPSFTVVKTKFLVTEFPPPVALNTINPLAGTVGSFSVMSTLAVIMTLLFDN